LCRKHATDDTAFVIVANKADLIEESQVERSEVERYPGEINANFLELSTKTGDGIQLLLQISGSDLHLIMSFPAGSP
jgi:putative ribosome biogenesis GTPase RsgA